MNLTRDEQDTKDEMDFRDAAQRELDDAVAKRAASGLSPEQLSLMDAGAEGQKAGFMGYGPEMNPYDPSTPERAIWEQRRHAAIGYRLNTRRRAA